ncbi:hypothetical protein EAE96_002233 [Botrytis aclada]|nr:hypothetical protein EAE96_002233 [Botrytis aclada]
MAITIDDISQTPTTQCALVINAPGQYVFPSSAPVPELIPTTVLIKVYAVAINPVDTKMIDLHGPSLYNCIKDYDFARSVFSIGSEVDTQKHGLKLGCRVAGVVLGGNPLRPDVGAFCQYVLADPRFLLRIPDVMSFEKAASLGVAVATVGMALYQSLGIEMPSVPVNETAMKTLPKEWALVLGGSTAYGIMAIQMLKL